jgi:uncharacterized membrane protein
LIRLILCIVRCLAAALPVWASAAVPFGDAAAADISDADALAITQKHCVMCHARQPTHPSFEVPPKGVVLETADDLRAWAAKIVEQVVEDRNMPVGTDTEMTDDERDALARWVAGLK